ASWYVSAGHSAAGSQRRPSVRRATRNSEPSFDVGESVIREERHGNIVTEEKNACSLKGECRVGMEADGMDAAGSGNAGGGAGSRSLSCSRPGSRRSARYQ